MKKFIIACMLLVCLLGCTQIPLTTEISSLDSSEESKNPIAPENVSCWRVKPVTFPMPQRHVFPVGDMCFYVGKRLYRIGPLECISWYDLDTKENGYVEFLNEPYHVTMWDENFVFIHDSEAKAYLTDLNFQLEKTFTSQAVQNYLDQMEFGSFIPLWDFTGTIFADGNRVVKDGQITYQPLGLFLAKNGDDTAELIFPSEAIIAQYQCISDQNEVFITYHDPNKDYSQPSVKVNSILNLQSGEEFVIPTMGKTYYKSVDIKNGNLYFTDGYYCIATKEFFPFQPECDASGYVVDQNNVAYYFREGRLFLYDLILEKEITTNYQMPPEMDSTKQNIFWVKPDGSQLAFGSTFPTEDTIYLLEGVNAS